MELDVKLMDNQFKGFIDRVDRSPGGGLIVADYKTGKIPHQNWVLGKFTQILLYGWAYQEITGETPVSGKLIYTKGAVFELEFDDPTFKEIKAFFKRTTKRMKKAWDEGIDNGNIMPTMDGFKPKTGPLCSWCSYIEHCEEGQKEFYRLDRFNRVRSDAPAYKALGIRNLDTELAKVYDFETLQTDFIVPKGY